MGHNLTHTVEELPTQGRLQDLVWGGGVRIFFQIWEAMRIARGFGGMLPREIFFKTVQFGAF